MRLWEWFGVKYVWARSFSMFLVDDFFVIYYIYKLKGFPARFWLFKKLADPYLTYSLQQRVPRTFSAKLVSNLTDNAKTNEKKRQKSPFSKPNAPYSDSRVCTEFEWVLVSMTSMASLRQVWRVASLKAEFSPVTRFGADSRRLTKTRESWTSRASLFKTEA